MVSCLNIPSGRRLSPRHPMPGQPRLSRTICSVAVLGAGHGGLALAGQLSLAGHRVALWNRTAARIEPVLQRRGIQITLPGKDAASAPVTLVTSSLRAALADVHVVLVAVPACAHADLARACAPHLRDGQTVLLLPGRTGGALEFRQMLSRHGCRARILLGEANTFPVAARCTGPAESVIFACKSEVLAAALPAERTPELLAACRPVLPMLTAAHSVLHTGLDNLGAILHPIIMLVNANRIERGDVFDFYKDGVTPEAAALLEAADEERLQIAEAYDVPACSLLDWIADSYDHHTDNIRDAVGGNPAYVGIKAPTTVVHRYLLEDVATGLIPMIQMGQAAGLGLPTLRSIVRWAAAVLGTSTWKEWRTLDVLGLSRLSIEEIQEFVQDGETRQRIPSVRLGVWRKRGSSIPRWSMSA